MPIMYKLPEALAYAANLHREQTRKASNAPYTAHLLTVAATVLEYGATEDTAIAALLHDALEDQAHRLEPGELAQDIRKRFGQRVHDLVVELTETEANPKPPWRERKEAYLKHLKHASPEAQLIAGADKLHNLNSLLLDLRLQGSKVWKSFNSDPKSQEWFYKRVYEVLLTSRKVPETLTADIKRAHDSIFARLHFSGWAPGYK